LLPNWSWNIRNYSQKNTSTSRPANVHMST